MINICYLPIITRSTQQVFFDYIDALDIPQIDYFAIGIQSVITKQSISLMSLPEWQKLYVENKFAEYDPIRRVSLYTKRNVIPFTEIDFNDNFGTEIMRQRSLMGIRNGIILMERFPKHNFMITLGTGFSKFDAFDFLQRYHDRIKLIKNDLITLGEKDAALFLPNLR